jgi:hypothetical protein
MKKLIAIKWAKALRSNKYKQGQNLLASEGEYCCLGVLCELYNKEQKKNKKKCLKVKTLPVVPGCKPTCKEYDGERESLPLVVQKWAGIKTPNGLMESVYVHDGSIRPKEPSLAALNDEGYSFRDIAQVIELGYEEL